KAGISARRPAALSLTYTADASECVRSFPMTARHDAASCGHSWTRPYRLPRKATITASLSERTPEIPAANARSACSWRVRTVGSSCAPSTASSHSVEGQRSVSTLFHFTIQFVSCQEFCLLNCYIKYRIPHGFSVRVVIPRFLHLFSYSEKGCDGYEI